jgi:hypothetical protein
MPGIISRKLALWRHRNHNDDDGGEEQEREVGGVRIARLSMGSGEPREGGAQLGFVGFHHARCQRRPGANRVGADETGRVIMVGVTWHPNPESRDRTRLVRRTKSSTGLPRWQAESAACHGDGTMDADEPHSFGSIEHAARLAPGGRRGVVRTA